MMSHQPKLILVSLGLIFVISIISSVHGTCTFVTFANARPNPATLAVQTSYVRNSETMTISKYTECMVACSLDPTCIACAYKASSNTCVFSSVTYNPATNDLSATSAGYQLFWVTGSPGSPGSYECPTRNPTDGTTPATTPAPTAGPTPAPDGTTPDTTPAPTAGPTPAPDCTGNFTTTLNTYMNGGIPQYNVTSQAACQQACLNDATCLSYDWAPNDPTSKCWLHLTTTTTAGAHYTLNSGSRVC